MQGLFKTAQRVYTQEKHILQHLRRGKLRYLTDYEILRNSEYPAEYPSTFIPVTEAEITSTKGRRAHEELYSQFKEQYSWHRNVVWFDKNTVSKNPSSWIAPSATVIGSVTLRGYCSIWYGAVLRADLNKITIDGYVNVQDGAVITTDDKATLGGFDSEVEIGAFTTIGHGARLHACKIEDECLIGNGAIVLEGAVVEHGACVAAGSVVPPGRRIPHMELWAGNPAVFKRKIGKIELSTRKALALKYFELSQRHALEFSTIPTQIYKEAEEIISRIEQVLPYEPVLPTPHWGVSKQLTINADVQYWTENDPKEAIEEQIARGKLREQLSK